MIYFVLVFRRHDFLIMLPASLPPACSFQLSPDTSSSTGVEITASRTVTEDRVQTYIHDGRHSFMYAPHATCNVFWLSWPAMQERAIARGTVVVFDMHDSVGNLFRTLNLLIQVRPEVFGQCHPLHGLDNVI